MQALVNALETELKHYTQNQLQAANGALISFVCDWAASLLQAENASEPKTKQYFTDNGCECNSRTVYSEYAPVITYNTLAKVTTCAVENAGDNDCLNNITFAAYLNSRFIPALLRLVLGDCPPFITAVPIDGITRRAYFNRSEPFAFEWCSVETGEGYTIEQWQNEASGHLADGVITDGGLLPFCDWVHIFVSDCNLCDYDDKQRFNKLYNAFGDKKTAPFLINNVVVGEVTIKPTHNNDYSFIVNYNADKLSEVMPHDMAQAIIANDSNHYYVSDYC
nr:MAG TPA: hypothetical protein [Caudoviricetes sp.]